VISKKIFLIITLLSFIFNISLYAQNKNINKTRIAILEFKGDGIPKGTANNVSELLRVEMVKTNKYIIIERTRMDAILKEQGFQQTGCTDETCAVKIGKILSANKIMIGNVMKLQDMFVITSRIVDVETGSIELAEKESAKSEKDLYNAVQTLARNLTESIEERPVKSAANPVTDPKTKDAINKLQKYEPLPFSVSYGGWLTTAVIDEYSSGSSDLMSSVSIAQLWLKTSLPYNSYIYLRGKDVYTFYIKQPANSKIENKNNIDLDAGYFYMPIANNSINYSIGRKFYLMGSGLVFNGRGDGGEFNFYSKYADLKLFGAYTGLLNKDSNPYKLVSNLYTDDGKRIFAGGTISRSVYNQTVYLLGLYQTDKNDDIDNSSYPNAKSNYNSQYYGLGFNGTYKSASYFGEYIIERGESYTNPSSTSKKQSIKASAALLSLNYYFDVILRPVLLVQYAYGSGDPDRNGASSPTGNAKEDDKGFIYFGSYSGGYGLKPYLSNIHIYRAGVSLSPLNNSDNVMLKRINISAIYSNYQKDLSNASINGGEANEPNKDIGHGFDMAFTWQIFSDMSLFCNYALFIPGSAYASGEKNRTFIMAGLNLSF
jgi:hypothetical protein